MLRDERGDAAQRSPTGASGMFRVRSTRGKEAAGRSLHEIDPPSWTKPAALELRSSPGEVLAARAIMPSWSRGFVAP
jgi:hypothetical protein